MPWKAFKTGNQYCVHKLNASGSKVGSSLGCHSTRPKANRQVAALNIAEETKEKAEFDGLDTVISTGKTKEVKQEEKAHLIGIDGMTVPISVTSFEDLDAMIEANEMVGEMKETTLMFAEMAENIFLNDEIEDKAAALQSLANEFANRVDDVTKEETEEEEKEVSGWQKVLDALAKFAIKSKEEPPKKFKPFHIWKEQDQYKWLAVYSNNIRDNDNPPEIIASDSHKRFVEMVDKGQAPLPELWLWHIKEWKWGEATSVAYDDKGFACALGIIDKNEAAENVAEWLKERDDILTSHGMPKPTIGREDDDSTIIIEHVTREISPLFDWAAANKFTGFTILKEKDMAIPDEKRQALIDAGLPAETLVTLEQQNEATADKASEAGLETKEEDATTEEETKEQDDLTETVRFLIGQVATLAQVVKELQETKQTEKGTAELPPATLLAYAQGIFKEENKGAEEVAGPKETEAPQPEGLFPHTLGWITSRGVQ